MSIKKIPFSACMIYRGLLCLQTKINCECSGEIAFEQTRNSSITINISA